MVGETLNAGGYRSDGRRQHELRNVAIDFSSSTSRAHARQELIHPHHTDGSVLVSQGLTAVMVSVFGPREARLRSLTLHDRAVVNVEVGISSFSSGERRRRGRGDKRTLEFAAAIKATFEPVIQTHIYPRSQIDIFVQVLQQDGGLLQTSINATTLALIDAGVPMMDYVAAVTCGVFATQPLLDLTSLEESDVPHLTLAVMPKTSKVTLVTMETRLHVDRFEELARLALSASKVMHKEMRTAVRARTGQLVRAMGGGNIVHTVGQEVGQGDEDIDETMQDI